MHSFEVKEEFMLDGEPIKIISGSIHYFRMLPSQWEDSLYNLKALGANTVETYIPWNLHEPEPGTYDFEGYKDVFRFIELADTHGLKVIIRPAAYISAEWEFGGLPAWLLREKGMRVRTTDERFMSAVKRYYQTLLPKLVPYQITNGGPVIMMQVENEYGSFGMDKTYLRQTQQLMLDNGIDVPLFTSDGPWDEALDAGTLIDDDVLVTGNFGSRSIENAKQLREFMQRHGKNWPLMSMEYWDGLFNRWGEEIIRRDAKDLADEVADMLRVGSVNLYMFHGGTNYGFYNGASARGFKDLPQVTSYDYDALLTEWGEPTEKYFAVQKAIKEVCPDVWQAAPRHKKMAKYPTVNVDGQISLFDSVADIADEVTSAMPKTMEELGSGFGYVLYHADLPNYHRENGVKIFDVSDRSQLYVDRKLAFVQSAMEMPLDKKISGDTTSETIGLDLLVENQGRVNYGYKLWSETQRKGLRGGIMQDLHFHQGYTQYALDFSPAQIARLKFDKVSDANELTLYHATFNVEAAQDTFIDTSSFGKGIVIVNGFNLGRYWSEGPMAYLYMQRDILHEGENDIVIFETEGVEISEVSFSDQPIYI